MKIASELRCTILVHSRGAVLFIFFKPFWDSGLSTLCFGGRKKPININNFLGSVFGRTDFSRIFIFEPPDLFADFVTRFFLVVFIGKSAQKNSPGRSPAKSSKIYTTKIPDTFLQRDQAKTSRDCPGNGWGSNFLCVVHSWAKRETQTKFPGSLRQMPGQSREKRVYVLSCFIVFSALTYQLWESQTITQTLPHICHMCLL